MFKKDDVNSRVEKKYKVFGKNVFTLIIAIFALVLIAVGIFIGVGFIRGNKKNELFEMPLVYVNNFKEIKFKTKNMKSAKTLVSFHGDVLDTSNERTIVGKKAHELESSFNKNIISVRISGGQDIALSVSKDGSSVAFIENGVLKTGLFSEFEKGGELLTVSENASDIIDLSYDGKYIAFIKDDETTVFFDVYNNKAMLEEKEVVSGGFLDDENFLVAKNYRDDKLSEIAVFSFKNSKKQIVFNNAKKVAPDFNYENICKNIYYSAENGNLIDLYKYNLKDNKDKMVFEAISNFTVYPSYALAERVGADNKQLIYNKGRKEQVISEDYENDKRNNGMKIHEFGLDFPIVLYSEKGNNDEFLSMYFSFSKGKKIAFSKQIKLSVDSVWSVSKDRKRLYAIGENIKSDQHCIIKFDVKNGRLSKQKTLFSSKEPFNIAFSGDGSLNKSDNYFDAKFGLYLDKEVYLLGENSKAGSSTKVLSGFSSPKQIRTGAVIRQENFVWPKQVRRNSGYVYYCLEDKEQTGFDKRGNFYRFSEREELVAGDVLVGEKAYIYGASIYLVNAKNEVKGTFSIYCADSLEGKYLVDDEVSFVLEYK